MSKKVWSAAVALGICALLLGGCATALLGSEKTQDTASAGATASDGSSDVIVAEVNGEKVYKEEYDSVYSGMEGQYSSEEEASSAVLDYIVEQKVVDQKLTELGYDTLSDEKKAQVEADMESTFNSIVEDASDDIIANLEEGYTQEELEAAQDSYIDQMLTYYGITRESYLEEMIQNEIYNEAYDALVGEKSPADTEIQAKYDEYVAADKEAMEADPASYVTAVNSGMAVYYTPAGVRRVRQVLILLDTETSGAIGVLREQGYDAQADILLGMGLDDIEAQAEEVISKIESGEITFDEAITQYNADPGMPEEGYPVVADAADYVTSFTEGAMSLGKIGDYTDLISSDYGYHIIEYYSDETEGPISYDLVKDAIAEELKTTIQGEEWDALVEQWKSEATITLYKENL